MLSQDLPRMGFETGFFDAGSADNLAAAIRPNTRMVMIEAVSNPTLRVADVAGIAAMAGVAYYVSWSRRQDQRPATARKPDEAVTLAPTAHDQYEHESIGWPDRSSQTSARQPSCSTDLPATTPRI